MPAGVTLLGHTGASRFQIRYSDDEQPVVWVAIACWTRDRTEHYQTAAALDPTSAILELCAKVVDGGQCTHCGRPTVFLPTLDRLPLVGSVLCGYQWDPELEVFRRSCEGDTP